MEFLNQSLKTIGFEDIIHQIKVCTPYGRQQKSNMKPYTLEDAQALEHTFDILQLFVEALKRDMHYFSDMRRCLEHILDLTGTLDNIQAQVTLTQVELYELKFLLLQIKKIIERYGEFIQRAGLNLCFLKKVYTILDPQLLYEDTFFIDDNYSSDLKESRMALVKIECEIRKQKSLLAKSVTRDYPNLRFRPNGTVIIDQMDKALFLNISKDKRLYLSDEHYQFATFSLVLSDTIKALMESRENLIAREEDILFSIRQTLTQALSHYVCQLREEMNNIGTLDLYLAKAFLAIGVNGTRPDMVQSGKHLQILKGRHIGLELKLRSQKKSYTPVDIALKQTVSLITGANMGGKTITLKMVGLIVCMAHYGLYVPADYASIPFYRYIVAIIGDAQSVDKGLSTFGAEMIHIVKAIEYSDEKGLILIDELARGTNPVEGWALSESIIEVLSHKCADTLITTHFDKLGQSVDIHYLQVVGLKDISKIKHAKHDDLVKHLSEHMDYRLIEVHALSKVPKNAIDIAQKLGLRADIIQSAKHKLR